MVWSQAEPCFSLSQDPGTEKRMAMPQDQVLRTQATSGDGKRLPKLPDGFEWFDLYTVVGTPPSPHFSCLFVSPCGLEGR